MTAPGTWQHVITAAGHHLRLIGANGEPVLTSEVYTDPRSVVDTLRLVRRTSMAGHRYAHPEVVDDRPPPADRRERSADELILGQVARIYAREQDTASPLTLAETGETLPVVGDETGVYTAHHPGPFPSTGSLPIIQRGAGHASETPEGGQA